MNICKAQKDRVCSVASSHSHNIGFVRGKGHPEECGTFWKERLVMSNQVRMLDS